MIKISLYVEDDESDLYDIEPMWINPDWIVSINKCSESLYALVLPTINDIYYTDIESVKKIVGDSI